MDFDANRDITIQVTNVDGVLTLASTGLGAHDRAELEIVGVTDPAVASFAAVIINQIANYTVNEKPVLAGQRLAVDHAHGALLAMLVDGDQGRLRIVEPMDDMVPLKTMITTVMLWKAFAAAEGGEDELAVSTLRQAIAYFPGDPDDSEVLDFPFTYNWQNHLVYAALSDFVEDPAESIAFAEAAFDRSDEYRTNQLGDTVQELARLTTEQLVARAGLLLATNIVSSPTTTVNENLVEVISPIWRLYEDGTGRRHNIVPPSCNYPAPPPALAAIGVEIVATFAAHPGTLARIIKSTVDHWEGGSDDAPVTTVPVEYQAGDMVLSAALAHVARLHAAGMTESEIRGYCGLAERLESAQAKYDALELAETEAIMTAMEAGLP